MDRKRTRDGESADPKKSRITRMDSLRFWENWKDRQKDRFPDPDDEDQDSYFSPTENEDVKQLLIRFMNIIQTTPSKEGIPLCFMELKIYLLVSKQCEEEDIPEIPTYDMLNKNIDDYENQWYDATEDLLNRRLILNVIFRFNDEITDNGTPVDLDEIIAEAFTRDPDVSEDQDDEDVRGSLVKENKEILKSKSIKEKAEFVMEDYR